jgi:hypothetical protein
MKADARPDGRDDGGREPLRAVLQGWSVPPVPAEIEDALRQEFRGRRPQRWRGLAVWLSLAAGFGLLAVWPLVAARLERRPAAAPAPSSSASASGHASSSVEPPAASPDPSTARRTRVGRRVPGLKAPVVVVEPSQAELLAEFGRGAWERPQAPPGASLSRMPAGDAPTYRAEWEEVAGEWPAVQMVVPTSER